MWIPAGLLWGASESKSRPENWPLRLTCSQSFGMSWRLDICLLIDGFARTLSRGTAFATNRRINWELFSREPDRNEQKPKLSAGGVPDMDPVSIRGDDLRRHGIETVALSVIVAWH